MSDPAGDDLVLHELTSALAPGLQLVQRLGAGGMGTVYLGRDPVLKRLVAIKVLSPDLAEDETARLRFAREAEATAAVGHPNVVSIYQVGALPSGSPYFVMQFIEGSTLADEFSTAEPAANPVVRRIVAEMAGGLAAAHAKGLIHRDVKPANVLIERDTGRTVVVDFGISGILEGQISHDPEASPKLTALGMYVGTPMYMSPEQAAGDPATDRSDVYSLGVVAFELVAGHPPFRGTTAMELITAHLRDTAPSLLEERPDADPELAQLIDSCLSKDPASRPSAADVARFLLPPHQTLEWPPPGLEKLRGTGSRLTSALGACAAFLWCAFATLLLQSTRTMPCCWGEFEGSSVFGGLKSLALLPSQVDESALGTIYSLVLVFSVLSLPVMWVLLGRRAWIFAGEARRARSVGYPWPVVLGAAWDRRTDTAALYNASGVYAVATDAQRHRFIARRRWESVFLALAAVTALLIPVAWARGLWSSASAAGAVVPPQTLAYLLAPVLVFLAAAVASSSPESAFRLASRGKRRSRRWGASTVVRRDLVTDWLGRAQLRPSRVRLTIPAPLVAVVACLLVAPMVIALAFVIVVMLHVGTRIQSERADLAAYSRDARRADWLTERNAFDSAATLPLWHDERARLVPLAFISSAARIDPRLIDTALLRRFPPDTLDEGRSMTVEAWRAFWMTPPHRLAPSLAAQLAKDTTAPGLGYWRAFAHSPIPSFYWYVADRSTAPDSQWNHLMGLKFYTVIGRGMARNQLAAALALVRGDTDDVILRANENLAAAWHFESADPDNWVSTSGAVRFLRIVGTAIRNDALVREASSLEALSAARDKDSRYPATLLFANPDHASGLEWVGDRTLRPALRWHMTRGVFWGYCLSAREILFGIDPRRKALADSVAVLTRDLGHEAMIRDDLDRLIRSSIADPIAQAAADGSSKGRLGILPNLIGLGRANARLALCQG